jgi:DNA-binding transcriptional LysR family regulator
MMTLAQLRTFLSASRHMSFSRAADELHLTQPAVSAQIVALENALKAKLFDRSGRRLALTDAGRLAVVAAEEILRRVDQLEGELADLLTPGAGTLKIGASHVVGIYLLPAILAEFRTRYPDAELVVRVDTSHKVVDMVLRNELDLGVIGEGTPVHDERLATKPIARDRLVLIAPPQHPLADVGVITPEMLAELPFVTPARDSASAETLFEHLRAVGVTLRPVIEMGNVGAIKRAVESGLGVSIISRLAVERELQAGSLVSLTIAGVPLERALLLCWHHERRFSNLATVFIRFLQKQMREGVG